MTRKWLDFQRMFGLEKWLPEIGSTHKTVGSFSKHVYKLWSIVYRNHLPNVADRVYKLTSSTQGKCCFKLGFVNDQLQSLSPKGFPGKKCLSCLVTKRASIYIRKIQDHGKTPGQEDGFYMEEERKGPKMSHGKQALKKCQAINHIKRLGS
jgi:hypothetical protein